MSQYWNKDNFEGLAEMGQRCESKGLLGLGNYCFLRLKGLKKPALVALSEQINCLSDLPTNEKRALADWIMTLHFDFPDVHMFLTQPLWVMFLLPVLSEWSETQTSAIPKKWLGFKKQDLSLLREAVDFDPSDTAANLCFVMRAIDCAWFDTHHLGENTYLGNPEDTLSYLQTANACLARITSSQRTLKLSADIQYFLSLVGDWIQFSSSDQKDFRTFCSDSNKHYQFPNAYYYGSPDAT